MPGEGGIDLTGRTEQEKERWIGQDYRLIRRIGGGGEGAVFLVRHCPTEQLRAAKSLKTDMCGRRLHELNMMKRLKHPALPQVFDVLEEEGQLWLILEYIRGSALSELKMEELTPESFFSIACQLAEVLAYLHSRKTPVLHLDIKPTNIMLRQDDRLVLIDFGAAVFAGPEIDPAARYGTPGFAAPEQKTAGKILDVRTDFYGIGAVLYYCLYGTVPGRAHLWDYGGRLPDLLWRVSVNRILIRCLQKRPEKRFQTDKALCSRLRRAEKRFLRIKQMKRTIGAVLFLAVTLYFALVRLPEDAANETAASEVWENQEFEILLRQADELGFSQAASCYEAAAALKPEDISWCERLLRRIAGDCIFSMEEEEVLKGLLYSVVPGKKVPTVDLLRKCPEEFGTFAYNTGILYWYFYEGNGGRSAAANWFEQALESQNEIQDSPEKDQAESGPAEKAKRPAESSVQWLDAARVHAKIGKYYEKLGKRDINGRQQADFAVYWDDLLQLWGMDNLREDFGGIRREIAKELLSCLVMQAHELRSSGKRLEQLTAALEEIGTYIQTDSESGAEEDEAYRLYVLAIEAVQRAWMEKGA